MKIYLLMAICIVAIACSRKAIPVGEEGGSNFVLKVNEKITVSNATITLKEIRESRCPKGVQCIRGGEAVAVLHVDISNNSERNVQLCTGVDCQRLGISETYLLSADGAKYLFTLDSITPYPTSGVKDVDKKVHFTVSVSRR